MPTVTPPTASLNGAAVEDFRARLRGTLLAPGDDGYDDARKIYNAMIDKHPALIARCRDVADVIASVDFARQHDEHGAELPSMLSTMHLYPIGGAVQDVGEGETAWGYRDVVWSKVIVGVDPANNARLRGWTRGYWEALHPHIAGGAYPNFMMDEGEERVRASYRANYDRLAAVKVAYGPENLFRVNQNIRPNA